MRKVYTATCQAPACGKEFKSLVPGRKYCSVKCYASTPEFKRRVTSQIDKVRHNPRKKAGDTVKCVNCGNEFYRSPLQAKKGKRYCSRLCYREFMAKRFDKEFAVAVTYESLSGYDEFLTSSKLRCLVEGCEWEGDNLSLHMANAHNIKAEEFKRDAGFNLSTGVVSPALADRLRARGNKGNTDTLDRERALRTPGRHDYYSRERLEHMSKSALLRAKKE